jgi:hypothetical protein
MRKRFQALLRICLLFLGWQAVSTNRVFASDVLDWRTNAALVSADIRDGTLPWLLEQITAATGWRVFVEPDVSHVVSTKFKDQSPGDALRLLLGDLNFALIPEANATPKLFVFRTSLGNATQRVVVPERPRPPNPGGVLPGRTRRRDHPDRPEGSSRQNPAN